MPNTTPATMGLNPNSAENTIAMMKEGMISVKSAANWITLLTRPPQKAATMPSAVPPIKEMAAERNTTSIVRMPPSTSSEYTSLPRLSVPSQCSGVLWPYMFRTSVAMMFCRGDSSRNSTKPARHISPIHCFLFMRAS